MAGTLTTRVWEHAEGLRVVIADPLRTPAGKVLSLHLLSRSAITRPSTKGRSE
jgi:hypothetical protein